MAYKNIKLEKSDRVAIITLNRPDVLNALSLGLVTEVDDAITEIENDENLGAIVFTGAGDRAFSAGADIHENRERTPEERDAGGDIRAEYTWHLANSSKPAIGAINGLCYGGGTVMATSMDFLIGCEKSSFRFLAVNYGQMNATWSLPMLVGINKAKELLYSGREVFADEAYHLGLINHLFDSKDLLEKTIEIASGIAKNRSQGVANIKQMVTEHIGESLGDQFQAEITARKGRFKGLSVEEGFSDFLSRKGYIMPTYLLLMINNNIY